MRPVLSLYVFNNFELHVFHGPQTFADEEATVLGDCNTSARNSSLSHVCGNDCVELIEVIAVVSVVVDITCMYTNALSREL